jgi:hypothetical protein
VQRSIEKSIFRVYTRNHMTQDRLLIGVGEIGLPQSCRGER